MPYVTLRMLIDHLKWESTRSLHAAMLVGRLRGHVVHGFSVYCLRGRMQ